MIAVLNTELHTDPLAWGYAALMPACPGVVADKLNAETRTMVQSRFVTARTLMHTLGPVQAAAILDALQSASSTNSAVKWAMGMLTAPPVDGAGIDVGASTTRGMLDQLVTAAILTQAQSDSIKALAVQPCSRAKELGLAPVSTLDVIGSW